jgi:hypothetical protein
MRKNNCEVIRRELDELTLGEACSTAAIEHLRECAGCREFHQQQTRLREIVGSLGTVSAPADFDFRLRARLAGESSSAGFHLRSVYWPFARRGLAVVALLIVFATGVVLVRNIVNRQTNESVATGEQPAPRQLQVPKETVPVKAPVPEFSAGLPKSSPQVIRRERLESARTGGRRSVASASVDFSNERASVINSSQAEGSSRTATVFPIDVSLQSLRVSLDDGRGNARTISVPAISFGSQRMGPNGNQFAAKNVW